MLRSWLGLSFKWPACAPVQLLGASFGCCLFICWSWCWPGQQHEPQRMRTSDHDKWKLKLVWLLVHLIITVYVAIDTKWNRTRSEQASRQKWKVKWEQAYGKSSGSAHHWQSGGIALFAVKKPQFYLILCQLQLQLAWCKAVVFALPTHIAVAFVLLFSVSLSCCAHKVRFLDFYSVPPCQTFVVYIVSLCAPLLNYRTYRSLAVLLHSFGHAQCKEVEHVGHQTTSSILIHWDTRNKHIVQKEHQWNEYISSAWCFHRRVDSLLCVYLLDWIRMHQTTVRWDVDQLQNTSITPLVQSNLHTQRYQTQTVSSQTNKEKTKWRIVNLTSNTVTLPMVPGQLTPGQSAPYAGNTIHEQQRKNGVSKLETTSFQPHR